MKQYMKWSGRKWNDIWNGQAKNEMKYEMALPRNEMIYEMAS